MTAGLLLTFAVGILWSLVGVYYKLMAKWDLSVFNISLVTGGMSLLVLTGNLIFNLSGGGSGSAVPLPDAGYLLFVLASGFVNSGGSLILQRSMVHGKSCVTWAIGQSALVIPFLSITLIFGEPWNLYRVAGTAIILSGMVILSLRSGGDSAAPRPGYGIALALIAFAVLGLAQSMTAATSFFRYEDSAGVRPVLQSIGALMAVVAGKMLLHDKGFRLNSKALKIIFLLVIQGVIATLLQFKALDLLKADNMNNAFFPIAIGICIAGYSIWSMVFFREKPNRYIIAGTLGILAGIAAYLF